MSCVRLWLFLHCLWFLLCSFCRCLSCAILNLATGHRDSTLFLGAFCGAENPPREYWCMELYQPQTWRNWICKLCSKFFTLTVWFMSNLCDPNCFAARNGQWSVAGLQGQCTMFLEDTKTYISTLKWLYGCL